MRVQKASVPQIGNRKSGATGRHTKRMNERMQIFYPAAMLFGVTVAQEVSGG